MANSALARLSRSLGLSLEVRFKLFSRLNSAAVPEALRLCRLKLYWARPFERFSKLQSSELAYSVDLGAFN